MPAREMPVEQFGMQHRRRGRSRRLGILRHRHTLDAPGGLNLPFREEFLRLVNQFLHQPQDIQAVFAIVQLLVKSVQHHVVLVNFGVALANRGGQGFIFVA